MVVREIRNICRILWAWIETGNGRGQGRLLWEDDIWADAGRMEGSPRRRGWGWVLLAEGTARMESSVGKRKHRPLRTRWQKQMAKWHGRDRGQVPEWGCGLSIIAAGTHWRVETEVGLEACIKKIVLTALGRMTQLWGQTRREVGKSGLRCVVWVMSLHSSEL